MNSTCPACKSTNTKDASIRENNGIYGPGAASWVVEEKSICNDCGVYFKPMANEPTIDVMNGIIAEYMGGQLISDCSIIDDDLKRKYWQFNGSIVAADKLKYHKSWDSLIDVIKKTKGMHMDILQQSFVLDYMKAAALMNNGLLSLDLYKAHKGVYQFITWLNQQNKKDGTE